MSERPIDEQLLEEPLTRAEAYLLFSKLKRMTTATIGAVVAQAQGDNAGLLQNIAHARAVSNEIEPLLKGLIYGTDAPDDE